MSGLKPENQWTEEDRIAMTSMGSVHGGTWRPTTDGGLTRVSDRGSYRNVGDPSVSLAWRLLLEREALRT